MTGQEPLTITKKELVHRIADETRQTKVVVKDVIQRFLDQIVAELVAGNRLEFREFGVFEIRQRASRVAQNPRTLEKVEVAAKRVVKFKAGRLMRLQIGGDDSDEPLDDEDEGELEAPRAKPTSQRAPSAPRAAKPRGKSAEPGRPAPGATPGPARAEPQPPAPPVRPLTPPKPPSNSPF
ncbi:MAG: integration host factor subunit beta [Planctomycetes bacterium]|nr:integration host factor subunit beta [Planctomycetota bacterium]